MRNAPTEASTSFAMNEVILYFINRIPWDFLTSVTHPRLQPRTSPRGLVGIDDCASQRKISFLLSEIPALLAGTITFIKGLGGGEGVL